MPQLPPGFYRAFMGSLVDSLGALGEPLSSATAWRFLYRMILWQENVTVAGTAKQLPHIIETSDLKKGEGAARAERAKEYLRENLAERGRLSDEDLEAALDRLYKERTAGGERIQRNNVTGRGFEEGVATLIARLCPGASPLINADASTLRGFEMAPRGYFSRPDLALFSRQDFRVIVSTKWTVRKERLGTYLHESYFYRQRRPDLNIAFVVNEFQLNILWHLVMSPFVDRVYHVHLPLLQAVHAPLKTEQKYLEVITRVADFRQLFEDIRAIQHEQPLTSAGSVQETEDD